MVDSEYGGIMAVSANISKRYVVIMLSGNKTIEFVPRWNFIRRTMTEGAICININRVGEPVRSRLSSVTTHGRTGPGAIIRRRPTLCIIERQKRDIL
jgi:hypothetical protein